jgi:G6PDH family F420-dependent oxidoreductase
VKIGYFLSCEEYSPAQLIEQAKGAEAAGFEALWISDHYHPWNDEQGQAAFVWSMIGALSQVTKLPITTAVTCPTVRIHPAVLAQAASTANVLLEGRFRLGVGTGEALNEHILGDAWPGFDQRLEMLEEAVDVMRLLWQGGFVTHYGEHYEVDHAQIYTRRDEQIPIYLSGFGPKAVAKAAQIADGFVCTKPEADLVKEFRSLGGGDKIAQAGYKVCWGTDADTAAHTAHQLWANESLPGELAQVLPSPKHFEQASELVTEQMTRDNFALGPDVDAHVEAFRPYLDAGYDEIYISQIGGARKGTEADGFFDFYRAEVLPRLRDLS